MVTFLITSAFILGLFALAIYFWQKPAKTSETIELPPIIPPRALFSDSPPPALEPAAPLIPSEHELLSRAEAGDLSVLIEAKDLNVYDRVLNVLVSQTTTEAKLFSLASHVKQHELPVNSALAEAMLRSWQARPNRHATAKALHFAALANDAQLYREAVEAAMQLRRNGQLQDLSALELLAIFNGEFWLLSSSVRNSGLGFVLKRTLASAKRELESANKN
jgi:hypothetical protein